MAIDESQQSIESIIWLNVYEESGVVSTLGEVHGLFPERPRNDLISLVRECLQKEALRGRIGFYIRERDVNTSITVDDGVARLQRPETWIYADEKDDDDAPELVAYKKRSRFAVLMDWGWIDKLLRIRIW